MDLPVLPPLDPMLARLARELPTEPDTVHEPKWDGFRCLAFRDGVEVDLRSRNQRRFSRYFPELVEGFQALATTRFVVDGEILATGSGSGGEADFAALLARLHPAASRVERLRRETPATFIAFDLLAVDDEDLRLLPFADRRARLEALPADAPSVLTLTPATRDPERAAAWLDAPPRAGIDGVVAKAASLRYQSGKRAMTKVKRERTLDCVVAGFRWLSDRPMLGSLLLGLYDDEAQAGAAGRRPLRHIGVATSFTEAQGRALMVELAPLVTPLEGHPWAHGFHMTPSPMGRLKGAAGRWTPDLLRDWVPLRPERVCEVAYDQVDVDRLRHPARFRRWRPDRDPASCTLTGLVIAKWSSTGGALPVDTR